MGGVFQRGLVQRGRQPVEPGLQVADLVEAEARGGGDPARHEQRTLTQGGALVGEVNVHRAFVAGAALAPYQSGRLQPLEQGRQGPGVEPQVLAQLLHGQLAVFPQHQHHQVLGGR
ncbi:hypothetical protein GCM10020000_76850 [Streptomyces olivoverticillatus]